MSLEFVISTIRRAGLVALAGLLAGPALAAEQVVTIPVDGQNVIGTLETPDGPPAPVVLMLHGFTGSRNELAVKDTEEGVFSRTARQLAENGYASLRIDFRGSGESEGDWADTTFSGQIKDAVAAVDWLKGNDAVDGNAISVLGWSQGGLVGSHVIGQRPEIKSAVLWAPVTNPMTNYASILGLENIMKAIAGEPETPHTLTLPWGLETTLKGAFFQEMPTTSSAAAVTTYNGPLLVIVGAKDTLVAPQPESGQILLNYHPGKEKLVMFDTDHVWDAFSGPSTLDEKMIPTTLEWLNAHK